MYNLNALAILLAMVPVAAAALILIRRLRLGWRSARWLPREPISDPHAPEAIEASAWVGPVAWGSVVWAALTLVAATGWMAVSLGRLPVELHLPISVGVGYVWIGAALTAAGGVLVGRRDARGRTLTTWGLFVLGMVAFVACACLLMLSQYSRVSPGVRTVALYVAPAMAVHMFLDALVGRANRRVGSPPDAERRAALRSMYCHLAGLLALTGVPGLGVVGPFVLWRIWRGADRRIDEAGREAIGFQAAVAIVAVAVAGVAAVLAAVVSLQVLWMAGVAGASVLIVSSMLPLLAGMWAYDGDSFRYPLSVRLLR